MISDILSGIKGLTQLIQKSDNSELIKAFSDVQMQYMELITKYQGLEKENEKFKKIENIKEKYALENNRYYEKSDSKKERPLCTRCLEVDAKEVSLNIKKLPFSNSFKCPQCKNNFSENNGNNQQFPPMSTHGHESNF